MKPDRTRSSSFQFRIGAKKKKCKKIGNSHRNIYPSISLNKEKQKKNKKKPATKCVWWWCGPWGSVGWCCGAGNDPGGSPECCSSHLFLLPFPFRVEEEKKSLKPSN
jgi:hypothetical protein